MGTRRETKGPLSGSRALSQTRRAPEARSPKPEARWSAEAPTLHVRVDAARFGEEGLHRLKDLLAERTGDQPVVLHLLTGGQEVVLDAREMKVTVSEDLRAELEAWLGAGSVWQE